MVVQLTTGKIHKKYTISFKYTTEKHFKHTFRKIYAIGCDPIDDCGTWILLIYDGNSWTKYNFDLFETGIAGRSESSTYVRKYVMFQYINDFGFLIRQFSISPRKHVLLSWI